MLCNFESLVSSNSSMRTSIVGGAQSCVIRGSMGGRGGFQAAVLVDAKEEDVPVKVRTTHNQGSSINMYARYSRIHPSSPTVRPFKPFVHPASVWEVELYAARTVCMRHRYHKPIRAYRTAISSGAKVKSWRSYGIKMYA